MRLTAFTTPTIQSSVNGSDSDSERDRLDRTAR